MKILFFWLLVFAFDLTVNIAEAAIDRQRANRGAGDKYGRDFIQFAGVQLIGAAALCLYLHDWWLMFPAACMILAVRYWLFNRIYNRFMNRHPLRRGRMSWWHEMEGKYLILRHPLAKISVFCAASFYFMQHLLTIFPSSAQQFNTILLLALVFVVIFSANNHISSGTDK